MPHGDGPATAPGGNHDRPCVFDGGSDRLLDEQIDSRLEQRHRHAGVQARGSGDHGDLDLADQIERLGDGPAAVRGGDAVARLGERIDHGDQFHVLAGRQQPRMDHAQMPTANHRHFCSSHAALLRSRARP